MGQSKQSNPLALAVLVLLFERPMHPYELATVLRQTGKEHDMAIKWGSLYTVVRNLEKHGFIEATESSRAGRRPERTIYAITRPGRDALDTWLHTPVRHVRDVRSHLLMKLALLDRAGSDPADLLVRQRAVLEPIVAAIDAERSSGEGFDAVLLAWRRATASAALSFLDDIMPAGARARRR